MPEPEPAPYRVGQGVDVHALRPGRPLVLGGVAIPSERGLAGHSDADVLAHAVCDALLGAAGLGDLGTHFPSSDPRWAGSPSEVFLRHAARLLAEAGWQVANVDATVCCQAPRLGPFVERMRSNLARALSITPGQVRVAPKSTDGLGFAGRGEGIAALAVCLLTRG
ncbi:MAG TPA: 2-C-methyl-D-erythritol 2,4-cyclodiphosphate synthase [Actinomycetes bacterium]|nr:2-C-methyl-D-erythritol 2,4-cyclodiphosphate synthase [Actinomycetes bacterium]